MFWQTRISLNGILLNSCKIGVKLKNNENVVNKNGNLQQDKQKKLEHPENG
jgi:hypothetical protein